MPCVLLNYDGTSDFDLFDRRRIQNEATKMKDIAGIDGV